MSSSLSWAKFETTKFFEWVSIQRAIRIMEAYAARQRKRLRDNSLPAESRKIIEKNITDAQQAIADKDFETVSRYMNSRQSES